MENSDEQKETKTISKTSIQKTTNLHSHILTNAITIHLVTQARNMTPVSPSQITFDHFLNHIHTTLQMSTEVIIFYPHCHGPGFYFSHLN